MDIICNGETKKVEDGTTLEGFIRSLELNPDTIVAECDGRIIHREEYESLVLPDSCRLELIRFVGGG